MNIEQYRYNGKKKFVIKDFKTDDKGEYKTREEAVDLFVENLKKINELQQKLYAEQKEGVIFVFQAMDAAGKDGVIRTVFSTLTPHGVKEYCFKVPTAEELAHDYLWRFGNALPAKGHISIFNRSYYEDVLIGRVKELWKTQVRADRLQGVDIIKQRYAQIKDYEKRLYDTSTRVVKIFLNVSKDEQARRFISRIDTPSKNWKISVSDIKERQYWDEYQKAFEKMVNVTSTDNCPWYVVPADHKWYARLVVSQIVLDTLKEMDPKFPKLSDEEKENLSEYRKMLFDSLRNKKGVPEDPNSLFTKTENIVTDMYMEEQKSKLQPDDVHGRITANYISKDVKTK